MNDIAIRVEGLGKQYRLGAEKERYSTFGDQIRKWVSLRRILTRRTRDEKNPPFWALKDVSFEVKRGEVVGIIGRNGAGKSTLLKILSRITEPTEGEIDIHGRVGSLLEVGTGFHPELTGRENIYLNGAILGMRRAEVVRKFDEIVAFAEVEKFIDTPVKHYSSGMYTRLAFAVAAHIETEILIVDEVLAVGDIQFQKKCLGKMGDVAKGGRTVLFVSHNMGIIQSLCQSGIVLSRGSVGYHGNVGGAVAMYHAEMIRPAEVTFPRRLSTELSVTECEMSPQSFALGAPANLTLAVTSPTGVVIDHFSVLIYDAVGTRVSLVDLRSDNGPYVLNAGDTIRFNVRLDAIQLVEGTYSIGLFLRAGFTGGDFLSLNEFEITAPQSVVTQYGARGYVALTYDFEAKTVSALNA